MIEDIDYVVKILDAENLNKNVTGSKEVSVIDLIKENSEESNRKAIELFEADKYFLKHFVVENGNVIENDLLVSDIYLAALTHENMIVMYYIIQNVSSKIVDPNNYIFDHGIKELIYDIIINYYNYEEFYGKLKNELHRLRSEKRNLMKECKKIKPNKLIEAALNNFRMSVDDVYKSAKELNVNENNMKYIEKKIKLKELNSKISKMHIYIKNLEK